VTDGFASAARAVAHVFVEDVAGEADVWIDGDDGHHLQRVRRLCVDEPVTASDGQGTWRLCAIAEAAEGRLRIAPVGPVKREPALTPRVVIAFAPAKGDQAGAVVHQLVELGADAIRPITLHRSVVRWDGARGDRARSRLGRVIREAAMQSRRSRLPELVPASPLSVLARHPGLLVADPTGQPAGPVGAPAGAPAGEEWLVVVGPEGGLDPAELEILCPRSRLAVGPHVLRAVTAPVAALAALAGFRSTLPPEASGFSNERTMN
jgi:16S rRNA (uracil1498-N3)-methyltransferase